MGRPSQGIDKALLKAGVEEITEKGVRGVSVRSVCARAGVSLRMLNYYFGSKDNFIRLVLTSNYEVFLNTLQEKAQSPGTALERLRLVLHACIHYAGENKGMARSLWMDAHAGEELVLEIMAEQSPSHSGLMLDLISEAQESGELRRDIPANRIFMAVLPGIFISNLFADGFLPMDKMHLPPEYRPVVEDPVKAAVENFDCLIEGYRLSSKTETATKATLVAAARGRKMPRNKKKSATGSGIQPGKAASMS